jgi:hypothetical protein
MDGVFFSDTIVSSLDQANIEFTISVPFERFVHLEAMRENDAAGTPSIHHRIVSSPAGNQGPETSVSVLCSSALKVG